MLMALNSRGWTETTEPCKCFTAEDEEDNDVGGKMHDWPLEEIQHAHIFTQAHIHLETTVSTSHPKESLITLLMLSDTNYLPSSARLRCENWDWLSQEITFPPSHLVQILYYQSTVSRITQNQRYFGIYLLFYLFLIQKQ